MKDNIFTVANSLADCKNGAEAILGIKALDVIANAMGYDIVLCYEKLKDDQLGRQIHVIKRPVQAIVKEETSEPESEPDSS